METVVFHDPLGLAHETGPRHPERPARLESVMRTVRRLGYRVRTPLDPDPWPSEALVDAAIRGIHDDSYMHRLRTACANGDAYIDSPDSAIGRQSERAARAAVACAIAAVEFVMAATLRRGFVAMRPPGHHCERDRSMGFCLYNTVAIAAQHLIDHHGMSRIAIVDFDVHHGNGTQHLFETTEKVFYLSTHQHPAMLYPGTGYEHEIGTPKTPGAGYTMNLTLPPGSDGDEARRRFDSEAAPRLREFRPEVVLVSAGFDADARDPLAGLRWTPDTYACVTRTICAVADEFSQGRIVSVLEGGYHLQALAEGVERHLAALSNSADGSV